MLFSSSVRVSIRFSVWLVSCYAHVFVLATLGCNCYTATCIRSCWVIICCMLLFRRRSLRGHCWSRDAQQRSAMGRNAYVRRYAYSICHIYDGAVITTWLCYRMVHKTRGTIPFCIHSASRHHLGVEWVSDDSFCPAKHQCPCVAATRVKYAVVSQVWWCETVYALEHCHCQQCLCH